MPDYDKIGPCCQKIEDMMRYASDVIDHWPPYHKYTDGEEIRRQMLLLLRLATKARLRYYNKTTLSELDTEKEVLKAFIRTANATVFSDKKGQRRRLLSDHSFGVWSEMINEIGKLIGGWIQTVSKSHTKE